MIGVTMELTIRKKASIKKRYTRRNGVVEAKAEDFLRHEHFEGFPSKITLILVI
jgi:hypothetical protein